MNVSTLSIILEEIRSFADRCLLRLQSEESLKAGFEQVGHDRILGELLQTLADRGYILSTQAPDTVIVRCQEPLAHASSRSTPAPIPVE